jgi:sugar/nucleoside kinase (ribokinase family)
VVVTRGRDGCFCRNARGWEAVPGYSVEVVDTTGAGDAFVGGLLAGLIARGGTGAILDETDPAQLRPILRFANAVGALTTTVRGAIPALPTRDRVRAFLTAAGENAAAGIL